MNSTHVTSALVGPKLQLGLATERLRDQLVFSTNLVDNRLCSYEEGVKSFKSADEIWIVPANLD